MKQPSLLATIFLILLSSVITCFAQKQPKANLIDEFGKITCDDFLARADNFFTVLRANPSSKGYFVIEGNNDLLRRKLAWEAEFNAAAAIRVPDQTRLIRVRGPEVGDLEIQFWLVLPEAPFPISSHRFGNFPYSLGRSHLLSILNSPKCVELL
jgi:hypothetical protein